MTVAGSVQIEPKFVSGVTVATSGSDAPVSTMRSSQPAVTCVSALRITTSPRVSRRPRLTVRTNPRFSSLRSTRTGTACSPSPNRSTYSDTAASGDASSITRSSNGTVAPWRTTLSRQARTSSRPL